MADLTLVRFRYSKDTTIGKLLIGEDFLCYTLEDTCRAWGIKIPKETAIGTGKYMVNLTMSAKFKRELPIIYTEANGYEIKSGGIGFKGVRMHRGSNHLHTWGCPLLGMDEMDFELFNTKQAEKKVVSAIRYLLKDCSPLTLIVINEKDEFSS